MFCFEIILSLFLLAFPVVMYRYESWTIKKAEHRRIDAFELWCCRRLLRVPWTARTFTSLASISDKIHTPKPILQIACNQLQVIREHENINTQENE